METEPNTKKRWQAIIEFETEAQVEDGAVTEALGQAANSLQEYGADEVTLRSAGELRTLRLPAMAGGGKVGGVNESYAAPTGG